MHNGAFPPEVIVLHRCAQALQLDVNLDFNLTPDFINVWVSAVLRGRKSSFLHAHSVSQGQYWEFINQPLLDGL